MSAGPPGVIEKVDWTVKSPGEARERFGVAGMGEGEGGTEVEEGEGKREVVKVVELDGGMDGDGGGEGRGVRFWFPGFVGE